MWFATGMHVASPLLLLWLSDGVHPQVMSYCRRFFAVMCIAAVICCCRYVADIVAELRHPRVVREGCQSRLLFKKRMFRYEQQQGQRNMQQLFEFAESCCNGS
jgi:hypothetical protein